MHVKKHLRRTSHGRVVVRAHIKRDKIKKCMCHTGKCQMHKRKHKRLNWHTIGEYKDTPVMSPYKDAEPTFGKK